jgi:hypothetical protein
MLFPFPSKKRGSDCCSMVNKQFFNYIMKCYSTCSPKTTVHRMTWLHSSNVFWPSPSVSAHRMTWLSTQAPSSDQVSQSLLTGWHDSPWAETDWLGQKTLLEWRVMSSCEQRLTDLVRRHCLSGESCHPVSRDWLTWSEDIAWVESHVILHSSNVFWPSQAVSAVVWSLIID